MGKDKEWSPLQYHIKFLQYQDITRRVCKEVKYTMDMKNYLRTQITLYEEDKKEEASMRCSLLHGSWDKILQRRTSVTPFSLCSCHRIIMKFSGVITINKSNVHAKGQGQKSNIKVTEVKTQFVRFRTVTHGIHEWLWNDAWSLNGHRRGALLFFKVICKISRSQEAKKLSNLTQFERFWTVTQI